MKTILKALSVIVLVTVSTMCRKPLPPGSSHKQRVLHARAYEALEKGSFVITAREYSFPAPDHRIAYLRDTIHITMCDNRAIIRFSDDIFPQAVLTMNYMTVDDPAATIEKEDSKIIGDMRYTLRTGAYDYWTNRSVSITLYKGSNKCRVDICNGNTASDIVCFTGRVVSTLPHKNNPAYSPRYGKRRPMA